jgi:pyruvate,water dikinase
VRLVLELADHRPSGRAPGAGERQELREAYMGHFTAEKRGFAAELLDLARASYRLRDDDNIHLAGIEAELARAVNLGRERLEERGVKNTGQVEAAEVARALKDPRYVVSPTPARPGAESRRAGSGVRPRQLTGQPAGPGIGTGPARVVTGKTDLFSFKTGEILVCDAIEPEMTFVVPLAAGIVERRGGMLIHGAIIAREYGIPCVTGVPEVASLIETGDRVTVDGYLGIVVLG